MLENTTAYRTLKNLASKYPIILLSGPEGCALDQMAKALMPNKNFVDLNSKSILDIASKSAKTFLLAFPDGAIINAADKLPTLLDAVKYHIGRSGFTPGKYILISTTRLSTDLTDGKTAHCDVLGLTIPDILKLKAQLTNPFQIIHGGQLPDLLTGASTPSTLIDTILNHHVARHINTCNIPTFRNFLTICARHSATPTPLNHIAKLSGISAPTAKTWATILEKCQIARPLDSLDCRSPALFFTDTAILCHLLNIPTKESLILSPHRTRVVTTFAVNEIFRARLSRFLSPSISLVSTSTSTTTLNADWKTPYRLLIDPNIEVTDSTLLAATPKTVILHLGDSTYTQNSVDCISFRDWTRLALNQNYFS